MPPPDDAKHDLLIGLLALQTGMVSRDQLVAAFGAWTGTSGRVLADLLVEQRALDSDGRELLRALADRHLRAHGGDAVKSLAALDIGLYTRESLAKIKVPEIEATLMHVGSRSKWNPCDGDADCTASYQIGAATSDSQRFRVLRPHARGGLGAVFVALDEELHREVALKQILHQHADDSTTRQRFVLEAEITGGLEHPGIVPVYGLGTYADGRPYYAMRFIKGDSLKEAIERFHADGSLQKDPGRRSLELRKLLRRFIDVCNAIDYAHSRGVLHRDVKPGNIIVGKYGETLVVDWGLAKATGKADPCAGERTLTPNSDTGTAETLPGSALGTPAYMSPEQAAGDLGRLGPRSDVYSLGATLYYLLTGRPPFAGDDLGAILRAVQRREFRPPGQLDATIDPALEAICLMAMSLKPESRYATAKALADDIERWMADEPVTAWSEPFFRRVRRWARRNRTAVGAATATVLVALAGTAIVLVVQTQANRELRAANRKTHQERDLARKNFDLARKAVDDYLTRVGQNPLLKEKGLHDLQQELLGAALGYYRNFLAQRGEDPSLRIDTAAAHGRVGDIQIELGHPVEALAAYDQALALIEPLVRQRSADPALATSQVRLEAGRIQALRDVGSYSELIAAFDRAAHLGDELLAAGGGTDELPEILSRTYLNVAFVLRNTGQTDNALQAALQAHALADRATRNHLGNPSAARTLLWISTLETELLQRKGRPDEARRLGRRSIAFGRTWARERPRDLELRMHLAVLGFQLGQIEKNQGRLLEALTIMRSETDNLGALVRENPVWFRAGSNWAIMLNDLSQLQTDLGRYVDAEQSARTSIDLLEALAREVPSNPFYRIRAGCGYASLGKAHLKAGSLREALATLRKAVALLENSDDDVALYNMACTLALASTIAIPADRPSTVDHRRRDADRAVATIRREIELGFKNTNVLKNDPDLESLRKRPDFQALLMDLTFPANPFAH
jgi:serine/threonine-protein kinase